MANDHLAQVTSHVNTAREAAAEAEAALDAAQAEKEKAAAKVEEATKSADDAETKEDPTLNIKWEAASILSGLAKRAISEAAKAAKATAAANDIVKLAKGFISPSEYEKLEKLLQDARAHKILADENSKKVKEIAEAASKEAQAALIAEKYLNLEKFFNDQRSLIYERLESFHEIAERAGVNSDIVFIAEGLPIINGIINVGSKPSNYQEAVRWVRSRPTWGEEADPLLVLSALVFIYVVDRGYAEHMHDAQKMATWERIHDRVGRLL